MMDRHIEESDHSTESLPPNFLVLTSQSETQESQWDQSHVLKALPALKSQTPADDKNGNKLLCEKSDDENANVPPACVLVAGTESEVSRHEDTDGPEIDRVDDSEDDSDSGANVTVVTKKHYGAEDEGPSSSPIYASQDNDVPRSRDNLRNLFPTLSEEDVNTGEHDDGHIVSTPSAHIGSLHISQEKAWVPETVDESLDELAPSPGAYGDIPVIIPSSPTASEGNIVELAVDPDTNQRLQADEKDRSGNEEHASEEEDIGEDEVMLVGAGPLKTKVAGEALTDSLHLVYSAATVEFTDARAMSRTKDSQMDEEITVPEYPGSQDLALHLTQSQSDSYVTGSVKTGRVKSSSQQELSSDKAHTAKSTSTDSNGFHLSLPRNGGLIHPNKVTQPMDEDVAFQQQQNALVGTIPSIPSIPSVPSIPAHPSLCIARLESQSQCTPEAAFRIQKPDVGMTEDMEEGSEMNVFKKAREGRGRRRPHGLVSEESSEDYFHTMRSSRKRQALSDDKEETTLPSNAGDATKNIDQDADTQPQREGEQSMKETVEAVHPYEESTETYALASQTADIEMVDNHSLTVLKTAVTERSPRKMSGEVQLIELEASTAQIASLNVPTELSPSTSELKSTAVASRVKQKTPVIGPPRVLRYSPKDDSRSKSVKTSRTSPVKTSRTSPVKTSRTSPRKVLSTRLKHESRTGLKTDTRTKPWKDSRTSLKDDSRTRKDDSRSRKDNSRTRKDDSRTRLKDSGISEMLDVTAAVEPAEVASGLKVVLERIPSDPYTFHGTQSQPADHSTEKAPHTTTPLSSRKSRTMSEQIVKGSSSSSGGGKLVAVKPRPKKLKFTKIQKADNATNPVSSINAAMNPPVGLVSAASTASVAMDTADMNRSQTNPGAALRRVSFHSSSEQAPQATAELSDSQTSDQLIETVELIIREKIVKIQTLVKTVRNRRGEIVEYAKTEEECSEPYYKTLKESVNTHELPLVSPSRTGSSLTPGDLADISSGFSRSDSTGSKSSSLGRGLEFVSPPIPVSRDDSFVGLLTCSSVVTSPNPPISTSIISPSLLTRDNPLVPGVSREKGRISAGDKERGVAASGDRESGLNSADDRERIRNLAGDGKRSLTSEEEGIVSGGHVRSPNASAIEKTDSRMGTVVVSSSDGHRTSGSLFTTPEELPRGEGQEQPGRATPSDKVASPSPKKRAADSSQDSTTSSITSAQKPRTQESGGFSVHGSEPRRQRATSPLHLLETTDTDAGAGRPARNPAGSNSSDQKSSDDNLVSLQIPFQTASILSGERTAAEVTVLYASTPEIGSTVMARWKDGFFYPGKITKVETTGRFYIRFDDGDQMYVKVRDILLVKHIPIGQSVMVLSDDGYFECGMVVGYEQEKTHTLYKVSRDQGGTQSYSRSQIILSEDQASCLMSDEELRVPAALLGGATSTRLGDVSLDNLVVGERRCRQKPDDNKNKKDNDDEESPDKSKDNKDTTKGRPARKGTLRADKTPGNDVSRKTRRDPEKGTRKGRSVSKTTETPVATDSPTGSIERVKETVRETVRETVGETVRETRQGRSLSRSARKVDVETPELTSSRGRKRKMAVGPMATSTPTPKAKKTDASCPVTPSTSGIGGLVDSPSESKGHGRRVRVGLFDRGRQRSSSSSFLFTGMVFLLTHVEKSPEQKKQEKKLLQDSSLETSADESGTEEAPAVPFDKESLRLHIQTAGGVVLEKYDQAQVDAATKAFLISSTFQRTAKYFECLAAGIPCVSHQWILHSSAQGKLLDFKAYILPAGISIERRKLMEWNPCGSCLSRLGVMVASTNIKFQDTWRSILTISRCQLVNRLPVKNKTDNGVDVIVSDNSCPTSILHQAQRLAIPVVSTEWVIQCLVNGHMVAFDASPQYSHDFQES